MNRKSVLVFLVFILSVSCTGSKDIIAFFGNEQIERGELKDWSIARKVDPRTYRTDHKLESDMIRQLALEKILFEMATAAGFDKDPVCAKIRNAIYMNFLASYFNNKAYEKIQFSEKCANISVIRIFFKGKPGGADYLAKADILNSTILPALNAGQRFEDMAAKYSEDSAKKKGGSLGFVHPEMLEKEMRDAVMQLEAGRYTLKPVLVSNSICIIRVNSWEVITDSNIAAIIKEKPSRERIKGYIRQKTVIEASNRLQKAPGVVSRISTARYTSDDEFLFSAGNIVYTVGDVRRILEIFYLLKSNEVKTDFPVNDIKLTAERIFSETVIALEAERLGYNKKDEFVSRWKYLDRAIFTGIYKSRYIIEHIVVSEEEVNSAYNSAISAALKDKNKKMKKPDKKVIYSSIFKARFRKLKSDWEDELLKQRAFTLR